MDDTIKVHKDIHLQLRFAEFNAVVCEGNLEELVLSNKHNVVVLSCVKFLCSVRWFGGVSRGVEAVQKLSTKATADTRMALTHSHLQDDMASGAPLIFSGSRDPLRMKCLRERSNHRKKKR